MYIGLQGDQLPPLLLEQFLLLAQLNFEIESANRSFAQNGRCAISSHERWPHDLSQKACNEPRAVLHRPLYHTWRLVWNYQKSPDPFSADNPNLSVLASKVTNFPPLLLEHFLLLVQLNLKSSQQTGHLHRMGDVQFHLMRDGLTICLGEHAWIYYANNQSLDSEN